MPLYQNERAVAANAAQNIHQKRLLGQFNDGSIAKDDLEIVISV